MTQQPETKATPAERAAHAGKPVRVTISDPITGTVLEEKVLDNDYAVIVAGNRYVKHIHARIGGTHVVTISRQARTESDPGRPVPKHGSGP